MRFFRQGLVGVFIAAIVIAHHTQWMNNEKYPLRSQQ
jgi:hypothetical protein